MASAEQRGEAGCSAARMQREVGNGTPHFANEADAIKTAFEPYYEHTILSEGTDPNLLHDLENRIEDPHLFGDEETEAFAKAYFALRAQVRPGRDGEPDQSALYRILDPVKQRFQDHLDKAQQEQVRSDLNEFVRLYAFLSQIITFQDAELERLYLFSRYLKRVLPVEREDLPREIQEQIDMESYGIRETSSGAVPLDRGAGTIDPRAAKGPMPPSEQEKERLSAIIQELNDRFGAGLTEKDRVSWSTWRASSPATRRCRRQPGPTPGRTCASRSSSGPRTSCRTWRRRISICTSG
jgi:type I restriction enzyme, R subunit